MRFGVSHVLDAIERRLSTDPLAAGGVADLGEVIRRADLDGGRPAHLLRLGLIVDAVGRHLSDGSVSVYAIADRSVLSDTDLTANERMVIRRWSDDGKVEVLRTGGPSAALRAREVAALTGLPLLSRNVSGYPGLSYTPAPTSSGAALIPQMIGPGPVTTTLSPATRPPSSVSPYIAVPAVTTNVASSSDMESGMATNVLTLLT